MAWRFEESIVRGEIDNRQRGVVRGRLWIEAVEEAVVLELAGNACGDMAGCLLTFANTEPTVPMRKDLTLAPLQRGQIGDLTASRKVRVYDIPFDEAHAMIERGQKPPEHMANSLYLEWFSESNGRMVIESADFKLEISPPEWRMTPADEEQRRAGSSASWRDFLSRLDLAIEQYQRSAKHPDAKWDEHDYERLMKESDARTDKYLELLDKYGESEEARDRIDQEMGWSPEVTEEEAEEDSRRIDGLNAAGEEASNDLLREPDPHREGIEWMRTEDGQIRHPLQHRCFKASIRIRRQCKDLGLGDAEDDNLATFLFEFQMTSAKLAGALGGIARGVGPADSAFTVACLKRALDHLHKAQAGLEAVASSESREDRERVLPQELATSARREMQEIREGILRLMQEYRDQN